MLGWEIEHIGCMGLKPIHCNLIGSAPQNPICLCVLVLRAPTTPPMVRYRQRDNENKFDDIHFRATPSIRKWTKRLIFIKPLSISNKVSTSAADLKYFSCRVTEVMIFYQTL